MKEPKIILVVTVGVTCLFILYANDNLNSQQKRGQSKTHFEQATAMSYPFARTSLANYKRNESKLSYRFIASHAVTCKTCGEATTVLDKPTEAYECCAMTNEGQDLRKSTQPNIYPNYYEDNLHVEWQFNITKNYPESDQFEWSEPHTIRTRNSHGIGENGAGLVVPDDNLKTLMEKLQNENHFNLLASEMISLHRSLPDPRYDECKNLVYPEKLPTTSVIVIFHNEAWTTLLRTVWSVIDRSPIELIKEIVLVDDLSTWPFLKRPLDDYIEIFPVRIKLIRNAKREGLIRARLIGAQHATGQVLIFLDAHSECCDGWLQPLLARIASDRSVVAVPLIDTISSSDMSYTWNQAGTPIHGFRWSLLFNWIQIPENELIRTHYDKAAPVRTPTMVGCAFSIDRAFFFEIGAYDEGMNVWGGENLELALRVWQCGGSMEIIPCSHVGHLFRAATYSFEGDAEEIITRNSIRLVEVWMPEFREYFYAVNPKAKIVSGGDLSERMLLKERLKCKTFRWYLENVYPQSSFNTKYLHFGEIQSLSNNLCLDIGRSFSGDPVSTFSCHHQGGNQIFGLSSAQMLITSQELCLGVIDKMVVSMKCIDSPRWKYVIETKWLVHIGYELCMQAKGSEVTLGSCDPADDTFNWSFD